jgi:hypothetical protein
MRARMIGILKRLVPFIIIISLTSVASLYSQFLEDEEEVKQKETIIKEKEIIPDNIALHIKAQSAPGTAGGKCAIRISWDLNPKYLTGDYVVARSNEVIDNADKVRAARVIYTVKAAAKNVVVDSDCAPGAYYYVVLSKKSIIDNKIDLFQGINYTASPVLIGEKAPQLMVSKIKAELIENSKARLTWQKIDKNGIFYTVYRSGQPIDTENRLKEAEKIATKADTGEYIDEKISSPGTYYYAVTAKVLDGKDNFSLVADANFTVKGLSIDVTLAEQIKIKSIAAKVDKGNVLVTWKISGEEGSGSYRLFRTEKLFKKMRDVPSRNILLDVDAKDKQYTDKAPVPGKYYYGLLPGTIGEKDPGILTPGVNITRVPLAIRGKQGPVGPDDIDRILQKTFFKGNYWGAVKALQDLLAGSDNEEVAAKAKLFIGRSYIELGRYKKSLDFLILSDVKKHFPKEADFWFEFALTRIKTY